MDVTLREITAETVRAVVALKVAPEQERFVAPNAVSLAEALFHPEAWYRAIYRGDEPVGFAMLYDESQRPVPPDRPDIGIWRFMVDHRFQGRGIGKTAIELVIAHVRARGVFTSLAVSYVPGDGSPGPFYEAAGFRPTGEVDDGEIVMRLPLGG